MEKISEKVQKYAVDMVTDFEGKRVLMRIDVNTTLSKDNTVDREDWRIMKSLRTIEFLTKKGASVILLSHIGRDPQQSLKPVFEAMSSKITLGFIPSYDAEMLKTTLTQMKQGSVVLLENVRQFAGEEANDSSYLDTLVGICDLYVNDAFSVSHRKHASVYDVTKKLPSYFGLQFCDEVRELEKALVAEGNTVLLLGGAKFGTKLDLLKKLLPKVSYALVGGALANVFLKERGFAIGNSFYDESVDISEILESDKIILPLDAVNQDGEVISIDNVAPEDSMLDIGPETEKLFETIIDHADLVLWNGPMGKYEDNFVAGSVAMADLIANAHAYSVTGGGDTAAVILEENLTESFDFISTGGGAMLDFLVEGTLPGIEAIIEK